MRRLVATVVTTLLLVLLPPTASAAPIVLDQFYTPGSYCCGSGLFNFGYVAAQSGQTFTVGVPGTLARIDVMLSRIGSPADIDVILAVPDSIYPTSVSTPLAIATIHAADVAERDFPSTWTSIDFAPYDVAVSQGMVLAYLLVPRFTAPEGGQYVQYWNWNPPEYAGGAHIANVYNEPILGGWTGWLVEENADRLFRTYVDTCSEFPGGGHTGGCFPGPGPFPGVPEPTSLLLFGTGLVGLRAWRKRRG